MEILNVGPLELLLIIIIMFILLGPQGMIRTAQSIGRWVRELVRSPMWREIMGYSQEIRDLPNKILDETGLKETLEEVKQSTRAATNELNAQLREATDAVRLPEIGDTHVVIDAAASENTIRPPESVPADLAAPAPTELAAPENLAEAPEVQAAPQEVAEAPQEVVPAELAEAAAQEVVPAEAPAMLAEAEAPQEKAAPTEAPTELALDPAPGEEAPRKQRGRKVKTAAPPPEDLASPVPAADHHDNGSHPAGEDGAAPARKPRARKAKVAAPEVQAAPTELAAPEIQAAPQEVVPAEVPAKLAEAPTELATVQETLEPAAAVEKPARKPRARKPRPEPLPDAQDPAGVERQD